MRTLSYLVSNLEDNLRLSVQLLEDMLKHRLQRRLDEQWLLQGIDELFLFRFIYVQRR